MAEYIVLIYVNITMILLYKFFFENSSKSTHTRDNSFVWFSAFFSFFVDFIDDSSVFGVCLESSFGQKG